MDRKLRMGMIGGGQGAFIGSVHRRAALMDGQIELVCGAFSSEPERSKTSGRSFFLPENRCYGSFEELIAAERNLPEGERMDFVSIVTPNHLHFQPAQAALSAGFPVICDKPLAFTVEEAIELKSLAEKTQLPFALTHNYTGYPMVKEARHLVASGALGPIRKVVVEYPQGWLSSALEASGQKQASWRTDPSKSGKSGCMGDIGTHAENLAEYITGLKIRYLCADLSTFVPGRELDDDGQVLLRFGNGTKGLLYASQVAIGEENNLRIRVYGEKAGLEWFQPEPNTLLVKYPDRPNEIRRTGIDNAYLCEAAQNAARVPSGHPEGYIEAFANIYTEFARAVRGHLSGQNPEPRPDYPGLEDGLRGMAFIDNLLKSHHSEQKWTEFVV